jgi:hypothetical protein
MCKKLKFLKKYCVFVFGNTVNNTKYYEISEFNVLSRRRGRWRRWRRGKWMYFA